MKSLREELEVQVSELYNTWGDDLRLKILTGLKGLSRKITSHEILRPGKVCIDIVNEQNKGRVKILGSKELKRFYAMSAREKKELTNSLLTGQIPCFILTKGLIPGASLLKTCRKTKTPLFTAGHSTSKFTTKLESLLREKLTPFTTAHGVLLDVYGVGVLILGKSGIGKSESALDLINRGSKLIADDIVEIRKTGSSKLTGKVPERIEHLMEIRGVGIINIKDLFGKTSVMDRREIEMVIELVEWNADTEYDRLGLDVNTFSILDVELPYLQIPLTPGRNTATIIEVAARNQLLRKQGVHSAEKFSAKHREHTSNSKS